MRSVCDEELRTTILVLVEDGRVLEMVDERGLALIHGCGQSAPVNESDNLSCARLGVKSRYLDVGVAQDTQLVGTALVPPRTEASAGKVEERSRRNKVDKPVYGADAQGTGEHALQRLGDLVC